MFVFTLLPLRVQVQGLPEGMDEFEAINGSPLVEAGDVNAAKWAVFGGYEGMLAVLMLGQQLVKQKASIFLPGSRCIVFSQIPRNSLLRLGQVTATTWIHPFQVF